MAEKQAVSSGGATPMCANGCGFFRNAATKNFCSKCYKDVLETAAPPVEATTAEETTTSKPDENDGNKTAAVAPPPVMEAGESSTMAVKEEKRQEEAPAVVLCVRGCGFFGSAATDNMCSKCYLDSTTTVGAATPDYLLEEMIRADMAAVATSTIKKIDENKPAEPAAAEVVEAPKTKPAPNRCAACRKKVGLLGFPCRCGGTFCSVHRYAEKHACEFDFKKEGREQIAKSNPLVVAPKLEKI